MGENSGLNGLFLTDDRLTQKQIVFCKEYVYNGNDIKQAMIVAGFDEKKAFKLGRMYLKLPAVKKYIAQLEHDAMTRGMITPERVATELAKIAFADIKKIYTDDFQVKALSEMDSDAVALIENISHTKSGRVKLGLGDRMKALELLGKHLNMFKVTHEHSGIDGQPIQVEMSDQKLAHLLNTLSQSVEQEGEFEEVEPDQLPAISYESDENG